MERIRSCKESLLYNQRTSLKLREWRNTQGGPYNAICESIGNQINLILNQQAIPPVGEKSDRSLIIIGDRTFSIGTIDPNQTHYIILPEGSDSHPVFQPLIDYAKGQLNSLTLLNNNFPAENPQFLNSTATVVLPDEMTFNGETLKPEFWANDKGPVIFLTQVGIRGLMGRGGTHPAHEAAHRIIDLRYKNVGKWLEKRSHIKEAHGVISQIVQGLENRNYPKSEKGLEYSYRVLVTERMLKNPMSFADMNKPYIPDLYVRYFLLASYMVYLARNATSNGKHIDISKIAESIESRVKYNLELPELYLEDLIPESVAYMYEAFEEMSASKKMSEDLFWSKFLKLPSVVTGITGIVESSYIKNLRETFMNLNKIFTPDLTT